MSANADVRRDKLKVALPMLTLLPGGVGGGETYVRELSKALAQDERVEAKFYLPANAQAWVFDASQTIIESVKSGGTTVSRLKGMLSAAFQSRRLWKVMAGADLVHFPLTVPLPIKRRHYVQTFFDTQHLDLPELFSLPERMFRRIAYDQPARRADAVLTISEFTKAQIVKHLGIAPEKIFVCHLGVDTARFTPNRGERGDFLFYPARAWPHKNHARLFEAFAILRKTRPNLRLVLSGGGIDTLGELPPGVEWAGHVSVEELAELYRTAAVLVFPSLYEGFGLPPVEAMAAACPVACSNAGSLPEICGDAAVYFDPEDPRSIVAGVEEAINNGRLLSDRGPVRAAMFTWESCADAHVAAYLEAVGARH